MRFKTYLPTNKVRNLIMATDDINDPQDFNNMEKDGENPPKNNIDHLVKDLSAPAVSETDHIHDQHHPYDPNNPRETEEEYMQDEADTIRSLSDSFDYGRLGGAFIDNQNAQRSVDNSRKARTLRHLHTYRYAYLNCAGCLVVGGLIGALSVRTGPVKVQPKINQIMSWKPTATLEVHIEALGDPGNIVQDISTGTIYASQREAARSLNVSPSRVSEHLKGAREHINGHKLVKLGKAFVSEETVA